MEAKGKEGVADIQFDLQVDNWNPPQQKSPSLVLDGPNNSFQQYWLGTRSCSRVTTWPELNGTSIKVLCVNLKSKELPLEWRTPKAAREAMQDSDTDFLVQADGWVEIPGLIGDEWIRFKNLVYSIETKGPRKSRAGPRENQRWPS